MPAPFTSELCGYRSTNGKPNMSDSHDTQSVRLGTRFLTELGIGRGRIRPEQDGTALEKRIVETLRRARPDLHIDRSCSASRFAQYAHLDVFPAFRSSYTRSAQRVQAMRKAVDKVGDPADRARLAELLTGLEQDITGNADRVDELVRHMPEESLLNIDVVVGIPRGDGPDELAAAFSAKWSLRTDRAQDCVSQGTKLVAQRRGRMPHFGVITVETRPAMLRILADGSGAVDWVYHLDLPALQRAIEAEAPPTGTWSPKQTFDRLMGQGRLRDFDDLVDLVEKLPQPDRQLGAAP